MERWRLLLDRVAALEGDERSNFVWVGIGAIVKRRRFGLLTHKTTPEGLPEPLGFELGD
jgi:hypothetical protein